MHDGICGQLPYTSLQSTNPFPVLKPASERLINEGLGRLLDSYNGLHHFKTIHPAAAPGLDSRSISKCLDQTSYKVEVKSCN
jgi:hypothetical protein